LEKVTHRAEVSVKGKVELDEAALNSTAHTLKSELDQLTQKVREKAVAA
jgi:hypothetical protein